MAANSPDTMTNYWRIWLQWQAFALQRGVQPLGWGVPPRTLAYAIANWAKSCTSYRPYNGRLLGPVVPPTIQGYLAAVKHIYRMVGFPDPTWGGVARVSPRQHSVADLGHPRLGTRLDARRSPQGPTRRPPPPAAAPTSRPVQRPQPPHGCHRGHRGLPRLPARRQPGAQPG